MLALNLVTVSEHQRFIQNVSFSLRISTERHRAEVRRAVNDERLNTIAFQLVHHFMSLAIVSKELYV